MPLPKTTQPPARIQIQAIEPIVDCGRYAVKRTVGDRVDVYATVFKDGHDTLAGAVRVRGPGERELGARSRCTPFGNDRWGGVVHRRPARPVGVRGRRVDRSHRHVAGRDPPQGRCGRDRARRRAVGGCGAARPRFRHGRGGARRGGGRPRRRRHLVAARGRRRPRARALRLLVRALPALLGRLPRRRGGAARSSRSSASTWSTCRPCIRSGTRTARGRTTRSTPDPGDPARRGRSARRREVTTRSIPELGTWARLRRDGRRGEGAGIELALDFAIQCSPDHPWLKEHPEWFYRRPDGTLKYAENPPKRYQDIYNVNFDSEDWHGLWQALLDVVLGWVERGITVFRVDNPHTKPAAFWEWLIREVRAHAPRGDLPRRGVHAPGDDDDAREARLRAELHVLHLEEHEGGARRVHAAARRVVAVLPAERVREHAGHPPRVPAARRAAGVRGAARARGDAVADLRHLLGLRVVRERAGARGLRGVPRLGEVRGAAALARRAAAAARRSALNRARRDEPALQVVDNIRWLETENDALVAYAKDDVVCVVNIDPHLPSRQARA